MNIIMFVTSLPSKMEWICYDKILVILEGLSKERKLEIIGECMP